MIVVCSQIHAEHTNTLCGQNVEFLLLKLMVHIVTAEGFKWLNSINKNHILLPEGISYTFIKNKICSSKSIPRLLLKVKAIPLQTWTGSRRFRLPDFKTVGT